MRISRLPNNLLGIIAPLVVALFVILTMSLQNLALEAWLADEARLNDPVPTRLLRLDTMPNTFLWAWDRPEQLDFIDIDRVGVAYLAKTIRLRDQKISVRPRTLPLTLREGTKVIAVARIESDYANTKLASLLQEVANEVAELGKRSGVSAVQVDFDATVSERDFYRRLLSKVRERLPSTLPLSITALASWCAGDNWLYDLPIDEAVPMLFRMGADHNQFTSRLETQPEPFKHPCLSSAGVSTDEVIQPPSRQRIYIFSPKAWTRSTVNHALETYQR